MERILALHALSTAVQSNANNLFDSTHSKGCSSETANGCSSLSAGCVPTTIIPPTGDENFGGW